jgi:myo-inositol-1(or 4)-monophosphatase
VADVASGPSDDAERWFAHFRAACDRTGIDARRMTTAERAADLGRGAGGDITAGIDRVAEDHIFTELRALHQTGVSMTILSEEAGVLELGGGNPIVVIDPIDGSQNAKRGAPVFCTAIGVADGPTMGQVRLAYIRDYGSDDEFIAERGVGAWLNGRRLTLDPSAGRLRSIAVEGASPARLAAASLPLIGHAGRLRALGSLALSMCWVAADRCDAMLGLGRGRAVDVAGAQLIVREAGGIVGMPEPEDVNAVPLDLVGRRRVMAARRPEHLGHLREALAAGATARR